MRETQVELMLAVCMIKCMIKFLFWEYTHSKLQTIVSSYSAFIYLMCVFFEDCTEANSY